MASLHSERHRERLLARLERLSPDARPVWGRMTVDEMLCHLIDGLRMTLGDLHVSSLRKPFFHWGPVKALVFHVLPFPRSVPTARELLTTKPHGFPAERQRIGELVERVGDTPRRGPGPEHPLFGPLDWAEWAVVQHKHIDHHLRQFGC